MVRRIAEGSLSFCVVLLMFGTSAIAQEGDFFFDLSPVVAEVAQSEQADAIQPAPYEVPADCPEGNCQDEPPAPDGIQGWQLPAPHFELPSRSSSLFRSPASYGWGYEERCCPRPWMPRGNGIPRRTSHYRMDYAPYVLQHDRSKHGPAFYRRFELYPCEECHLQAKHLRDYYGCRY